MTKKRKSFVLHIDSLEILDDLDDQQVARLFRAIKSYQNGEDVKLDTITKMVFLPFKNQFARDDEKYEKTCEARAEAGAIGGRVNKRESGEDNNGKSQLYVLRLYNEDEDFIKIGTTTTRINRRFSGVKNMPYEYEIIHQLIGEDIELETEIQKALSEFEYSPKIKFPGHTECFSRECLNKLKKLHPFAQAKHSKTVQNKANQADNKNDSDSKSDSKSDKDKPKRKVKTLLPSDFVITKEMVDWYGSQNFAVRMAESTDRWIDAMKAGGYKYVDWQAAWRNGMKKANEWYLQKNGNAAQTKPRAFSQ